MKSDQDRKSGHPSWAQKPWWLTSDHSILEEYLKVLIGIKKNIPNINARIHEVCTVVAQRYLSDQLFQNGKVLEERVNPNPRRGPDIKVEGITAKNQECNYQAEVLTNFSFEYGTEADKLYEDIRKLMKSTAEKKYIVVLSDALIHQAKKRCKNRRQNPIDLDKQGIEVLSIEKMIGVDLL